jgi:hypothetical protein
MLKNRILPDGTKIEEDKGAFYKVTEMGKNPVLVKLSEIDKLYLEPKRTEIENAMCEIFTEIDNEAMNWKCEYYQDGACYWSNLMCDKTKKDMEDCRGRLD